MSRHADPIIEGFAALEQTLVAQETGYRALRASVTARRDAIRVADLERLKGTLDAERVAIARLGELDRKRTEIAVGLARRLGLLAAQGNRNQAPPALSELIAKAPTEWRERLGPIASRLRDEINAARHESGVVRDAAERLAQHVAGILQSVSSAFATTRTYGRAGRFATAGAIRSIDIRS